MASADDLDGDRPVFDYESDPNSEESSSEGEGPPPPVPIPNPPNPNLNAGPRTPSPDRKHRLISDLNPIRSNDDSRRLFQRLFTDEEEITILKGFLDFVSQRGTTQASYQYDTGPFYDQIRNKLQLDFSKSQLVEKLRRLKKKYRTAVARIESGHSASAFKTPHDRATFEISRQIWSPTFKRPRDERAEAEVRNSNDDIDDDDDDDAPKTIDSGDHRGFRSRRRPRDGAGPVEVAVKGLATPAEESLRSCLTPLFRELLDSVIVRSGEGSMALGFGWASLPLGAVVAGMDERWRQQQIMELEVFAKRMELVKEHIESKLLELKSKEGSRSLS